MYYIVGIEMTSFKDRETNRTYEGVRLHTTYEKEGVDGFCVESFYCNSRVDLDGIDIGDTVEVLYNRYGKVASVRKVG